MNVKKLSLLAIFLGILMVPIVYAHAAASKIYEVTTQGTVYVSYGTGGSSEVSYVYYGGSWNGVKNYYNTEKEYNAAIKKGGEDLKKWMTSLGVKESNMSDFSSKDVRFVKIVDGVETDVQSEEDADKIYVTASVGLSGNMTVETDNREEIKTVKISDTKIDFEAGDTPTFTTKVESDTYSITSEYWYVQPDPNASGYGVADCHTRDEIENEQLKKDGNYFEKFESGKIYAHQINISLTNPLKYKFTKNTKIYLDGKLYNYNGSYQDGIYISKYILDLASKTSEEKTKAQSATLINEVLNSAGFDDHTGITDELAAKINTAVQTDKEVKAELTVTKISDEAKKEIDEKIKDKVTSDMNIVTYLDISIPVVIDGKEEGFITKLQNDTKITINAPENIPAVKDGYERTYAVVRLHDGEVKILPVTVNADGSLSFESDSFSDYVLTYADKEIKKEETSEENKEETKEETTSENKEKTPETLDNIQTSFLIAGISILGLLSIRKLKNN